MFPKGSVQSVLLCKRFPPTTALVVTPNGLMNVVQQPVVQATQWCHEFKERVGKPISESENKPSSLLVS